MTLIDIYEDNVEIYRYSKDGIHKDKSAGVRNNYKVETLYNPNKKTYISPQIVKLNNVK